MAKKDYSTFIPQVIPKQFNTNECCQMVAIYDEDLSDSPRVPVTLIFPGDQAGSSPKRVVPERVGTRTLVFKTPEYKTTFANRSTMEVLPILHHPDGDTELKPFTLTIKNAIKGIIELCVGLATSEAVLPTLITLMLHCTGEKMNFQDPQFDRILSVLVGSRTPESSISIKDIVLPKKWQRRMDLTDLCREYQLTCAEDQANILKCGRRLTKKVIMKKGRQNQSLLHYENLIPLSDCGMSPSTSEPCLSRLAVASSADVAESIEDLEAGTEEVCHVTMDQEAVPYSDVEVGREKTKLKLKATPSNESFQKGSQPIKGSFSLRQHLVRDPYYENVYVVKSSEKHSKHKERYENHDLSMSTDTGLEISPHIGQRQQQKALSGHAAAGGTRSPMARKKVAPLLPPKPSQKQESSSSDSEGTMAGPQAVQLPLLPQKMHCSLSHEVQPQPAIAVLTPMSHKNKTVLPHRQHKRSEVQTFSNSQTYPARQEASDHQYEDILSVRPRCRGRQHYPPRGHEYPAQTWQQELKQRVHRDQADSGWSSGHTVSDDYI